MKANNDYKKLKIVITVITYAVIYCRGTKNSFIIFMYLNRIMQDLFPSLSLESCVVALSSIKSSADPLHFSCYFQATP